MLPSRASSKGLGPSAPDSNLRMKVTSKRAGAVSSRKRAVTSLLSWSTGTVATDPAVDLSIETTTMAAISSHFPDSVGAALEADLDRIPDGRWARTLLMPLAFAEDDRRASDDAPWAELASVLGTELVTEQDVRRLVGEGSASTLIIRTLAGRYRLYHDAFAEHLRVICPHDHRTRRRPHRPRYPIC
jgi:hypothetical protein